MSSHRNNEHHIEHHKDGAHAEPAHSKLHSEAVDGLTHRHKPTNSMPEASHAAFSQNGYWAKKEADYYRQGEVVVLNGDTLNSIAKKALEMRGASTAGPDAILDEADRIRALNMTRPAFKYLENSHRIHTGMVLDISEPRIGPDIHTAWQPWKDAKPGETTYVHHGERTVAQPGSKVIVEPGAAAIITPGAAGFGYQKSYIESMPGSVTVAAGEVQAAPGAAVLRVRSNADVKPIAAQTQQHPELFPN